MLLPTFIKFQVIILIIITDELEPEYNKPTRQPMPRPTMYYPEASSEKMAGMKRKLPKK